MSIDDLWYRNAIIYCLDVEKYMDLDGDGVGDFEGLSARLPHLAGLGITCVWLLPFSKSPNRDNGYDVTDYYSVHEKHGSLGDFVEFANHARSLGIRVVVDLVVNHTSIDHPWFQHARRDPASPFRDWYVWSKERPANHDKGMVFPGVQKTTWTWDDTAGAYYFHRFYEHQADLNTANPAVREEITKIMGFWLELGISGFRLDAVPFLIGRKGADVDRAELDYDLLHQMRDFLQWRRRDAILLAEANVPPDESKAYFGDQGDHLQMMLNFPVNQRLWYALATGDIGPLQWAIRETRSVPAHAQFVQFLRSHDECDLGRLTDEQRQKVFEACGPDPSMQLYDRGIRRRLAPMLHGDRRRIELAFSLLLSLPGTPMLQYGDEIGIWDDLSLPERECARTAMQWSDEHYGGFSTSREIVVPIVEDEVHGYRAINVASQRRDPDSLLNWTERRIRARKELPELGWGDCEVLETHAPPVMALRYEWRNTAVVSLHNFAATEQTARVDVGIDGGGQLCDYFGDNHSRAAPSGRHEITLGPYAHRWYRVGGVDTAVRRAHF
ncbi:MAG TPA: alpha-amylase family protein [Vicinamibacterales bacterium]|nr:alpha-amylase family protein [Vicinamibacterales bacterium]